MRDMCLCVCVCGCVRPTIPKDASRQVDRQTRRGAAFEPLFGADTLKGNLHPRVAYRQLKCMKWQWRTWKAIRKFEIGVRERERNMQAFSVCKWSIYKYLNTLDISSRIGKKLKEYFYKYMNYLLIENMNTNIKYTSVSTYRYIKYNYRSVNKRRNMQIYN